MFLIRKNFLSSVVIFFDTFIHKRWFDRNGYIYFLIPKFLSETKFKQIKNNVEKELSRYADFFKNEEYQVFLVNCGVFGSYREPNKIFVYAFRDPKDIARTIIHESLHLKAEKIVKEKKLDHEQKERLIEEMERVFF